MTPTQKSLVQATWKQVIPLADAAAIMFYDRLFEIDPTTKPLFRQTDMPHQRKKLLQIIGTAVASLERLDALVPVVEDLGRRHAGYGVEDKHYDSVGAALLWTLERGLGKTWTPEVAEAWTQTYGLLSGVMRRAQASVMKETAAA
jgi:hemoglobin-like flavoprotein